MNTPIDPWHWNKVVEIGERGVVHELAQTLANDEAKGKALAEIHAKLVAARADGLSGSVGAVAGLYAAIDLAAPYRASDPVAEALKDVFRDAFKDSRIGEIGGYCLIEKRFHDELASRGLEIVERRERS